MLRFHRDGGERGFALIAILSLAALVSAFLIASALNLTSAGVSNEREQRSMNALREAKAALIAYAANEKWQDYNGQEIDQPGALPCPDISHNGSESDEGDSDCLMPLGNSLIGRLPYKTIGIGDLRDASGERLWYALSASFRKVAGTTIINSDTRPCDSPACSPGEVHLNVTGAAPASNVVAVLFAPGEAIGAQVRSPDPTGAGYNDAAYTAAANYLEGFNPGDGVHFTISTTPLPLSTFNDRVVVITQAELMAAVEPAVAARIERDVAPLLTEYLSAWGAYPYAVPFAAPPPAQSSYAGIANQTRGLLPVSTSANFSWASATVTQLASGYTGNGTVNSWSCTINSSPLRAVCEVNYATGGSDRPALRLDVFLQNANLAFANAPSPLAATHELTMIDAYSNPVDTNPPPYGDWSLSSPQLPPTRSLTSQVAGGALSYTGRLQNGASTGGQVTITVLLPPPPSYLPRLTNASPTNPNITWFIANEWYRHTYYAVSPGYASRGTAGGVAPGSVATCSPLPATPSCLTVGKLPPQYTVQNNKQAILVLVGRDLSANRPSNDPADYLEGANLTAANNTTPFVYEHRAGVPTAIGNPINDRVVVVAPPPP